MDVNNNTSCWFDNSSDWNLTLFESCKVNKKPNFTEAKVNIKGSNQNQIKRINVI